MAETAPLLDDDAYSTARREEEKAKVPRPEDRRPLAMFCPNPFIGVIWTAVIFNYGVHVAFRPERWNALSLLLGHAILGLQIASFVRCQLTHPGRVPDWWDERANNGLEADATKDHVYDKWLPPRSRWVNNAGCVVLGLDHYCFWVSSTIGHYNRKHFILFLYYSMLLAAFVGVHAFLSCYTLLRRLEPLMGPFAFGMMGPAGSPMIHQWHMEMARRRAADPTMPSMAQLHNPQQFLADAFADVPGGLVYQICVFVTLIIDLIATIFLCGFFVWQCYLVVKARTTIDPDDDKYDTGSWSLNTKQVLGRRAVLWLLPVGGPDGDGLSWPAPKKAS